MLAFATACFDENETFGALDIIVTQSTALSVFDSEVIRGTVDELECGKDFAKLRFDGLIKWEDVLE
jgi:hypothetical protein